MHIPLLIAPVPVPSVRAPEAVAALGQLKPAGEVRRLAAPVSGFGGTPRIAALLVKEGDQIRKGQPLAIFDNRPQIEAEIAEVDAQIQSTALEVKLQEREVSRFAVAAKVGAAAMVVYEEALRVNPVDARAAAALSRLNATLAAP